MVDFWSSVEQNEPQKCPNYYWTAHFDPCIGSFVVFYFWGWFEWFLHKLRDIIFLLTCKLQNVNHIRLCRHIQLLPCSWNYNIIHDLKYFDRILFLSLPPILPCSISSTLENWQKYILTQHNFKLWVFKILLMNIWILFHHSCENPIEKTNIF